LTARLELNIKCCWREAFRCVVVIAWYYIHRESKKRETRYSCPYLC